mmetsp:Transcript_111698/g.320924  ORF Transcript_111698/g.320924 Transcript_111698/m.320924 type:complete len:624 (-) Transcript_111698:31-1902(-)
MDLTMGSRFDSRFDTRSLSKLSVSRPQSTGEDRALSMAGVTSGSYPRRSHRVYSESARRKSIRVPQDGTFLQIKSVFDIYKQVRLLVGMVSNVWSWTCSTTTLFRQVLPGLARVHVGNEVVIVPGYLLQDLEQIPCCAKAMARHASHGGHPGSTSVTDPAVQDLVLRQPVQYFHHLILLLKLRWLLRLHSACCELDYKVCSLRNLILGIQYVVLQQHEEVECDSVFDTKVSRHIGSHLNLESVFDDIVDQLQRALGGSWRGFLEYISSCDPSRRLEMSKMDSSITSPKVVSNDSLAVVIDTIFVANFLRQSRKQGSSSLRELYAELEMLGVPVPETPPLREAQHLKAWAKARSSPAIQRDRSWAGKKDSEKLAQLDAVLLTAAIEHHLPEVIASAHEMAETTANASVNAAFPDEAPKPAIFSAPGSALGNTGPPAARLIMEDKPQLKLAIFDVCVICIHHHDTFPDGLRERLYAILNEEYGLTQAQMERLAIGATQNIDGKRLSDAVLIEMEGREKVRLRKHMTNTGRDTMHLLAPPLVEAPIQKGAQPKFMLASPSMARQSCGPNYSPELMSRSLPDLQNFARPIDTREPFKVPKATGPLTMDPELKKLRNTGFFMKMGPRP